MIASLMMYNRPETAKAHDVYWAQIRTSMRKRGIETPEMLSNDAPVFDLWRAPDLVFSQTCGLPYRKFLSEEVAVIGTPDFGIEGCLPGHYNSAVVVRKDDPRQTLEAFADSRLAYNDGNSQSGFGAIHALARGAGFWFSDMVESGAHHQSAALVAQGDADIAAIDAQTWRYIQRFDAFASELRVLVRTKPTPSLPYITAKTQDADLMFDAVKEAIEALRADLRAALNLRGIVRLPKAAYMALEIPPAPV